MGPICTRVTNNLAFCWPMINEEIHKKKKKKKVTNKYKIIIFS